MLATPLQALIYHTHGDFCQVDKSSLNPATLNVLQENWWNKLGQKFNVGMTIFSAGVKKLAKNFHVYPNCVCKCSSYGTWGQLH